MSDSPVKMPRLWLKAGVLPVLCGALYVGAFPPVGLRFLVPVALLGLLHCLRGLEPVAARCAGFLFGMTVMTLGCSWLHNIFGGIFLGLAALHALFYGLFGWGHAIVERQNWGGITKALAIACIWTGVEYLRAEHFRLDFPWMTPGHGLAVIPYLTQPLLATMGVYGVGFVVVLVCSTMVRRSWGSAFGSLVFPFSVIFLVEILPVITSLGVPAFNARNKGLKMVSFAAIQSESGSLGHFYQATESLASKPDLVVWPEESMPYDILKAKQDWALLQDLVKKTHCVLVAGTQQGDRHKGWFNTALTLDETGILGRHFKNHPVHLFNDGTPGTEAHPVATRIGKIGTPICFDCDYQDVVRRMTLEGADFFAVPSMDPVQWGPLQRLQHAVLFRIRAAENGRAMVVCATSGVTQIIDGWGCNYSLRLPDGHVSPAMLEPLKDGVLTGVIPIRTGLTLYTCYGWLFPWMALLGAVIFIIQALRCERRARVAA